MTTEQLIFTAGMQVTLNGQTKDVQNADHLALLIDAGWQVVEKVTAPNAGNKTKGGKRRLTKAEAITLSDANLSESFGLPTSLASKGENFTFKVVVTDLLEMQKRLPKVGTFPGTQVEFEGAKFCILFDAKHDIGNELNCVLKSSFDETTQTYRTNSKLTVEVVWN